MKKRIVSLILVTLLVAGLLATAVFAAADPTPYVDGSYGTCVKCDDSHAIDQYHAEEPATCVATGKIEYYRCSKCDACYQPSAEGKADTTKWIEKSEDLVIAIDSTNHVHQRTYAADYGVYRYLKSPATCESPAVYYWSCADCNAKIEGKTFEHGGKLQHSMTEVAAVPPTHDTAGTLHHWHCSTCNNNYEDDAGTKVLDSVVDPATGHNYTPSWSWTAKGSGWAVKLTLKCSCNATKTVDVTPTYAVVTSATATNDGLGRWTATYTLDGKIYKDTKDVTISKTGVDYYYGAVLYFNSNGGSTVTPIYTNTTKTVDLTKYIPTRRGYTFAGWYADARLTTPISSITLYPTGYRYNNYNSYTVYAGWYDDTWCSACSFWDVDYYDWYHDEIRYVVDNGIMEGISSNWFAPEEAMTRADLVVAMYRIAGSPSTRYTGVFTDVKSTADYAIAVEWAAKYGIVNGVGNKKFDPNSAVTREQMAAIFYRFGKYVDKYGFTPYRTTGFFWNFSKLAFADTKKISNYAKDPVAWCVKNGIFYGDNSNRFNPQDNTTRGECAAILYRFCK